MQIRAAGRTAPSPATAAPVELRMVEIDGRRVRVGIRAGTAPTPLLIFNGIGANLELMEPFTAALPGIHSIVFDVPGVGGSDLPAGPYRLSTMVRLAGKVLTALGHDGAVDVLGVSWGGALAQQFAWQHGSRCRKLILAATSAGMVMIPGRASVLARMVSPRRYVDPDYLLRVGPTLYGGSLRRQPDLLRRHARHLAAPRGLGYAYQMLAMLGWTSVFWLALLRQPTLVMAGRDDPIVPLINARLMAALLRRATLAVLDDGHLFLVTKPRESAAAVLRFLAGDAALAHG